MKRRKSGKDDESAKDSRSKEKKSSSTSKDASQSQHKSFHKSVYTEEPSYTVEESSMQQDQEFVKGDNDEQPVDKAVTKDDWFKKPKRPTTPDPNWITRLTIMKKYDYGHQEEIEVRQDDQQLYTFKEGGFKRQRLQDIEDMLLLLVQQKLTNLTLDERSNLINKTAYTSHSEPHRILYVDQFKRKRLMCTDELHKFSDGTLNDVRTALRDIATRIRMDYLPMRKWSNLDKKRARVMVQDKDKKLVGYSISLHFLDPKQKSKKEEKNF
uniref:Uncharacterized protein n=1 Tax=Tanacetum cinerariifolium TaxID=118510 RepID=A0A6L2LZ63_TANCI|nr:hypothetical protein [Tanacetum cinerariifolium]